MQGVEIGPVVFSGPRVAAITGMILFLTVTRIPARRQDPAFRRWSGQVVIFGIIAARLGFVALHWPDFLADPLSILYVWQDGYSLVAASAVAAGISLFHLCRAPQNSLPTAFSLAVAITLAAVVLQITADAATASVPDTPFVTTAGNQVILSDRNGKPLVINLWASWCPPCHRELPMMADIAAEMPDADIMFANQGERSTVVQGFLARANLTLGPVILDSGQNLSGHNGALGLPVTLFIAADGRLQNIRVGEISRSPMRAEIHMLKGNP